MLEHLPHLLLCPPIYTNTNIKNNIWMRRLPEKERKIDVDKAMQQWFDMYSLLSNDALMYILPPKRGLQDQVYITNAGAVLPHLKKTVVLSNFRAKGRPGEELELKNFITKLDYNIYGCPYYFEGEAELKWIRENIYVGGYGIRTEEKALDWISDKFGAKIIKIKESDPLRYHLDCSIFSIDTHKIMCPEDIAEKKELEKIAECIYVSKKDSQFSITNCVRLGSIIYNATSIQEIEKDDKDYLPEKEKNEKLEKICRDIGLELVFVNLSEFDKSGAALSCCILHLTRIAYPSND